jgi:SAM-dependent methyltransferase
MAQRHAGEPEDWAARFFSGPGLEVVRDPDRERTAPLEADWIRNILRLRTGDRLLDVPCGAGRIAAVLAASGIRVTGLDASLSLIREARRRCEDLRTPPVFRTADMRELSEPPRYEAAINWWGSFGYFSEEDNRAVVQGLADALRPGGRLLVDTVNREHVRRHALGRHDVSWEDVRIIHVNAWDDRTERLEGSWEIHAHGRTTHGYTSIRLYTPAQARRLASDCGLVRTRLYGDWTGRSYRRGSHRLVLYAERPHRAPT